MNFIKIVFRRNLTIVISFTSILFACGLEQDVTVKLPIHESQLVVECYLEPGSKAHLLLTESSGYFDSPRLPFVNDAVVTITYNNITDTLKLNTSQQQSDYKFFNYISRRTVPADYAQEFFLNISDEKGRKITSKTKLMQSPKIDTVKINFSDSSASLIAYFKQDMNEREYYRAIFHKDSLSNIVQNVTFSDEFSDTESIAIGTGFDYKEGGQGFVTLYKLDKSYYDFIQSIEAARNSNGNPFAQPSSIKSNVEGGIGIFTGVAYDFKMVPILKDRE